MIMMENTNGSAVLSSHSHMPFLHSLMARGTTLANYHAVYHPSDENYLAIAGGDTYAQSAAYWPDIRDPHPNLGDELQAQCQAHLVDTKELGPDLKSAATTPDFSWLAADDYDDGEQAGNGDLHSREVQTAG